MAAFRKVQKWLDKVNLAGLVWLAQKELFIKAWCNHFLSSSCCHGRTCCSSWWPLVGKGRATDVLYLDLHKVFDAVRHDILISKMERHGFDGCTTRWVRNWQDGRSQRSVVNGLMSRERSIMCGAPHELVLGPTLLASSLVTWIVELSAPKANLQIIPSCVTNTQHTGRGGYQSQGSWQVQEVWRLCELHAAQWGCVQQYVGNDNPNIWIQAGRWVDKEQSCGEGLGGTGGAKAWHETAVCPCSLEGQSCIKRRMTSKAREVIPPFLLWFCEDPPARLHPHLGPAG